LRIQFLVAAHKNPEFLARLCQRLLDVPEAAVRVQWDCATRPPEFPRAIDVDVRPTRAPSEWGSGRQLDALLDSLRSLCSASFDWLLLLSGQDYPIRPVHEVSELLASTPHRLFLDTGTGDVVHPPARHEQVLTYPQERYFYHYHWLPDRIWSMLGPQLKRGVGAGSKRFVDAVARGRAVRVQRRPENRFSPGLGVRDRKNPLTRERPCRIGSDWFAISRAVFDDLVEQIEGSPDLVEHFRHTYLPTEAFFHTLLLPRWATENAGHNLHYLRFMGANAHPEIVVEGDWYALVESGAYFARKFDATDVALLDRIDRELLSSEPGTRSHAG
jgi:Core-2/I-Branching enzyme